MGRRRDRRQYRRAWLCVVNLSQRCYSRTAHRKRLNRHRLHKHVKSLLLSSHKYESNLNRHSSFSALSKRVNRLYSSTSVIKADDRILDGALASKRIDARVIVSPLWRR